MLTGVCVFRRAGDGDKWMRLVWLVGWGGVLLTSGALAQPFFEDVTAASWLDSLFMARGVAIADYNNDGWPDLLAARAPQAAGVYLGENDGAGRFVDVTAAAGPQAAAQVPGGGPVFGDYDNDGDADLYMPVGNYCGTCAGVSLLLRNDRGQFTDVTAAAGLPDTIANIDNAIWLDYDRDGHLDLYVGMMSGPNRLYRNQGNGTFADATAAAGVAVGNLAEYGTNGGMAAADFSGDGWPDLYVGVWYGANRLFLGDGSGAFRDATTAAVADTGEAYGVAVGDLDNDGDFDIFHAAGGGWVQGRSPLLENDGTGVFADVLESAGLARLAAEQTGGPAFGDIDNDADLDLLTAFPTLLFLNNGDGTFVDGTLGSGLGNAFQNAALGDFDVDGSLDALYGSNGDDSWFGLYHNLGNGGHWLRVEVVGRKSNRSGIGARLSATAGQVHQVREILGGRGYAQDDLVAHFGLGDRTQVDQLEIRWPSGRVESLANITADQTIRVIEGQGTYCPVERSRWHSGLPDAVVAGTPRQVQVSSWPALFEASATITQVTADLSALGGPAALALTAAGQGRYLSGRQTLTVTETLGVHPVSVVIDQQTSLGPRWTRMSRNIAVLPAIDLVILDEGLAPGWQATGNSRVDRLETAQAGTAYGAGQTACLIAASNQYMAWSVTLTPPAPTPAYGYVLHFAVNLTAVTGPSARTFTVTGKPGGAVDLPAVGLVDLTAPGWQEVNLPVSMFGLDERQLTAITFTGKLTGELYLDDVRLVAIQPPPEPDTTAVGEDRNAGLPEAFGLAQNYPNPFNSSTVVSFALPAAVDVELVVYNLTGQRVATLARGLRAAGSYRVTWDGTDEQGRALASGVYLYRLRAGDRQEKVCKLLLVR